MLNWLKIFMFCVFGFMVRIKYKYKLLNEVNKNSCNYFLFEDNCELVEFIGNYFLEFCKSGKKCIIDEVCCEENGNSGFCCENDWCLFI